ncbi:MAG TPA: hypothetical protein VG796_01615 [Verrucomicrobiales bacterium]|nr:hypothetical protein [Verrucomicrobiales bacterium]
MLISPLRIPFAFLALVCVPLGLCLCGVAADTPRDATNANALPGAFEPAAVDQLLLRLHGLSVEVRHRLLMELVHQGDSRALEVALTLIDAPDRQVYINGESYTNFLIWSSDMREDALNALSKWGSAADGLRISPFLSAPAPESKVTALQALRILDARAHKEEIARLLDSKEHPSVRTEALTALTAMDAREYAERFIAMLDENPSTEKWEPFRTQRQRWGPGLAVVIVEKSYYFELLRTLAAFGIRDSVPKIQSLMNHGKDAGMTMACADALYKLGAMRYDESLRFATQALDESNDQALIRQAVRIIVERHASEQLEALLRIVPNPAAVRGIRDLGFDSRCQEIAKFLTSDKPLIREKALETLTLFEAGECALAVAELLSAKTPSGEREKAFSFLEKWIDPKAAVLVARYMNTDGTADRIRCLYLLRKINAREQIPAVLPALNDKDVTVASVALETLTDLNPGDYASEIASLLAHPVPWMRLRTLQVLTALKAIGVREQVFARLDDSDLDVRMAATETVVALWPDISDLAFPVVMESALTHPAEAPYILKSAQRMFGTREPFKTALPLLARRFSEQVPSLPQNPSEGKTAVQALRDIWQIRGIERCPRILEETITTVHRIVTRIDWTPPDAEWLEGVARDMGAIPGIPAYYVRSVLMSAEAARERDPLWRNLFIGSCLFAGLITFWLLVILLYPWFVAPRWIVWNRWMRWLTGIGLIVRAFRCRRAFHSWLWKPFREELLPPEETQTFDEWTFFGSVRMAPFSSAAGEPVLALRELRNLRGMWVIQGVSGLGKTTLLQCLAVESQSPAAFVRASTCQDGLLETIRQRLPEYAQGDPAFLRMLVKSGTLLVMIDAVHEAAHPVKERLVSEVDFLSGGKFLLTTQPVVRIAPKNSSVYEVLPLRPEDTNEFLLKQGHAAIEAMHGGSVAAKREAFASRVRDFLADIRSQPETDPRTRAIRRMLSNPMDAVFAAEVLASGDIPQPGQLLAQRVGQMKADYETATGTPFPELAFATHLCASRLTGAPSVNMDRFPDIAAVLTRYRLLRKGSGDDAGWRFRHDRIMDWLLLPALSSTNDQRDFLTDDPRFAAAREIRFHATTM